MKAITYLTARQCLAKTMEQVCEDHSPVIITRKRNSSVIEYHYNIYLEPTATLHSRVSQKPYAAAYAPEMLKLGRKKLQSNCLYCRLPDNERNLIKLQASCEESRKDLEKVIFNLVEL